MNYGMIATGNHTDFDSLRGAPPHGQCVHGAVRFVTAQTRSVTFLLCKFQFIVLARQRPKAPLCKGSWIFRCANSGKD